MEVEGDHSEEEGAVGPVCVTAERKSVSSLVKYKSHYVWLLSVGIGSWLASVARVPEVCCISHNNHYNTCTEFPDKHIIHTSYLYRKKEQEKHIGELLNHSHLPSVTTPTGWVQRKSGSSRPTSQEKPQTPPTTVRFTTKPTVHIIEVCAL